MTKRSLPSIGPITALAGLTFESPQSVLDRWQAGIRAADQDGENVIPILERIGADPFSGGGVTAKSVAMQLRQIGPRPVTVQVNSPGGSFFEGVAIHNLLREHPGDVTVKVLGLAASAASVIAMAGDRVEIAATGYVMVHNAAAVAIGNRHVMRASADLLEPFDRSMAELYAVRTGLDPKIVAKMMDSETWLGGAEAVEKGFADGLLASGALTGKSGTEAALSRAPQSSLKGVQAMSGTQIDPARAQLEARCQAEWNASQDLRAEFLGDFASFHAFRRAEQAGLVKTISGRVVGADRPGS